MYAVGTNVPGVIIVPTREDAIRRFRHDAKTRPEVRAAIMALPEDAVLGCWCKPKACHCDVIVELWYEWHGVVGKTD